MGAVIHNLCGHSLYNVAHDIMYRCNNKKYKRYHDYGGRGIECLLGDNIEDVIRALESIDGYFEGAQIDRIDNDGHYEIGNLRWVTHSENQHNKRTQKNNTTGYKGICYRRDHKSWVSQMVIYGFRHYKEFDSLEEAIWHRQSLEEYYHLKQFIKKEGKK